MADPELQIEPEKQRRESSNLDFFNNLSPIITDQVDHSKGFKAELIAKYISDKQGVEFKIARPIDWQVVGMWGYFGLVV